MGHLSPQPVDDELQAGNDQFDREAPGTYAQVPEWVALADISPQALALYVRLRMHVNRSRDGSGVVWPGMEALAKMMGYSRRQSLRPHLTDLSRIGALDIRRVEGRNGRRNVYVVHFLAHKGHEGPRSLSDFYDALHEAEDTSMGGVAPLGRDAVPHQRRDGVAPMNHTNANHTNPTTRTTPPGEDDCASSGRKQVPDPKLIEANGYDDPDPGRAAQAVIRSYVKALGRVGVTPTDARKKKVGSWVKDNLEAGVTRDNMWRAFCSAIDRAWAGDPKVAWMAPRPTDTGEWAA